MVHYIYMRFLKKWFQGRVDRKTFFIYSLFLLVLPWLNAGFYLYVGSAYSAYYSPWSLWIILLVIAFFSPFLLIPLAVRRLRDIGQLRWFITIPLVVFIAAPSFIFAFELVDLFLPVINLGTALVLSLIPGKGGADRSWFSRHPFRSIGIFFLALIISLACIIAIFEMSRCKGYDPETGEITLCLAG